METQLFIPKKIKVGYQQRSDTYTKRLAYVIYYDNKGKLRKETSWDGWRDKKIEPEEFDNVPTEGFVINKNVERYKWSSFGTNRSYIRIYDPRGIEFEVTPENLIGLLMNSDCCKRGFVGKFVYAWDGPDLVLLPTDCEEYQKATEYTKLQDGKVGAKTLIPGAVYKTKKEGIVTYIGKYDWYAWGSGYRVEKWENRRGKKYYIFINDEKKFITKSGLEFLSECVNPNPIVDYANWIEKFQKDSHSSKITEFELVDEGVSFNTIQKPYSQNELILKAPIYYKLEGNILYSYSLIREVERKYNADYSKHEDILKGYTISKGQGLNIDKQEWVVEPKETRYYSHAKQYLSEQDVKDFGFKTLYLKLDNGRRIKVKNEHDNGYAWCRLRYL